MFKPLRAEPKDPADQNTYGLDFTADMDSDSNETVQGAPIVTSSIVGSNNPSELIISNSHSIGNIAYCFVSGGVAGRTYLVSYEVNTTSGNVIKRSVILPVQNR